MILSAAHLILGLLAGFSNAQFPPEPEGVTVIKSKFHENVTISFKEPGICETTPGVKSYAGYVHLPPGFLDDGSGEGEVQPYPINTFFWFFEARKDAANAPLAIWLNGGPGGSSLMGLLEENGPCLVGPDSQSTYLNPWSWNNEVNMLYLDEPTQVGFSYDVPTNATVTPIDGGRRFGWTPTNFTDESALPTLNLTSRVGTFGSQKLSQTANSTQHAAHALWHFAQTWFAEFPHYKPADDRISLWAESYGGHYGPGFLRFFQRQNEKIANGSSTDKGAHYLHLDTLGIVNGMIDLVLQAEAYIDFPYNNTYGIQVFNESIHDELVHNWTRPDGCRDQLLACQDDLRDKGVTLAHYDPRGKKTDPQTNSNSNGETTPPHACPDLTPECYGIGKATYQEMGTHGWYDIGHPAADPFPAPHMYGYLTQEPVLAALGVPVNYSEHSDAVSRSFDATRDIVHGGFLDAIAELLHAGVKVHLVYGDRDYACNWLGGERASLAVPWIRAPEFARTGYAPLLVPDNNKINDGSYSVAGMTRQLGNFSFSRVYQSGHEVPSYQPAAAYAVFSRASAGRDIASGLVPLTDGLATRGPLDTWFIKNAPPVPPAPRCYVLKPASCLPEVWERVKRGAVVVRDWFVVDNDDEEEEEEEKGDSYGDQEVLGEL